MTTKPHYRRSLDQLTRAERLHAGRMILQNVSPEIIAHVLSISTLQAKHAFQHRQEIPNPKQRYIVDAYVIRLRLELEYAQQTLKAIDNQPTKIRARK